MCFDEGVLQAYLDGEVTESERRRIARHLPECPRCQQKLASLQEAAALCDVALAPYSAALAGVQFDASPAWKTLQSRMSIRRPVRIWTGWLSGFAVAAVFFLAVGIGIGLDEINLVRDDALQESVVSEDAGMQFAGQPEDQIKVRQSTIQDPALGPAPEPASQAEPEAPVAMTLKQSPPEGAEQPPAPRMAPDAEVARHGAESAGVNGRFLELMLPSVVTSDSVDKGFYVDSDKEREVSDESAVTAVKLLNASVPVLEVPEASKPDAGLIIELKDDKTLVLAPVPGDLIQAWGLSEQGIILVKSPELNALLLQEAAIPPDNAE